MYVHFINDISHKNVIFIYKLTLNVEKASEAMSKVDTSTYSKNL